MKIRVCRKNEMFEAIDFETVDAQEHHIEVGQKSIRVGVHTTLGGTSWSVTSPEAGSRIAWGETKREAIKAAEKKLRAIGYARYWKTVREWQSLALGGKSAWSAKEGSFEGYKGMYKSSLAKENIRLLAAAKAQQ